LPEEERQKIKICYLFWKKLMLARALIGNQRAVSAFHLNSFIFLDLLFLVISENSFPLFAIPTFVFIDFT
jgi:hypothetical protein